MAENKIIQIKKIRTSARGSMRLVLVILIIIISVWRKSFFSSHDTTVTWKCFLSVVYYYFVVQLRTNSYCDRHPINKYMHKLQARV